LWLNGGARPSAEPLYSAGSREEFPIPLEYLKTSYTDLLSSELKNTDNLVISQSISDGQLTAIFAPDASFQPRPGLGWGTMNNLNDLKTRIIIRQTCNCSANENPTLLNPRVDRQRHNLTESRPSKLSRISRLSKLSRLGAEKLEHSQL